MIMFPKSELEAKVLTIYSTVGDIRKYEAGTSTLQVLLRSSGHIREWQPSYFIVHKQYAIGFSCET